MADDKIIMKGDGPPNDKSSENNDAASDIATATDSYDEYDDDDLSQDSYQDDDRGRPLPMPPLKYARLMGSLPRE